MMIKTIAATSIALIICTSAAWYFSPKFLEQPAYSVLKTEGSIEVRAYEQILLQSVAVSGDQYDALRSSFRPLVRYIGAKERDGEKISMTAPVMQILDDTKQGLYHFRCRQKQYISRTLSVFLIPTIIWFLQKSFLPSNGR